MFSIRVFVRSLDDRLGVNSLGPAISSNWKELITSQLAGTSEPPTSRAEKLEREACIAIELSKTELDGKARLAEWKKRTGRKSLDAYYRLLKKV